MESAPIGRPPQAANIAPVARAEAPAAVEQVKTELPREQAVQQPGEDEAVQFENRPGLDAKVALDAAINDAIDRRFMIDQETRALIYQAVNDETGEVLRQYPEEMLLKLRTYARELQARANDPQADATVATSA